MSIFPGQRKGEVGREIEEGKKGCVCEVGRGIEEGERVCEVGRFMLWRRDEVGRCWVQMEFGNIK